MLGPSHKLALSCNLWLLHFETRSSLRMSEALPLAANVTQLLLADSISLWKRIPLGNDESLPQRGCHTFKEGVRGCTRLFHSCPI